MTGKDGDQAGGQPQFEAGAGHVPVPDPVVEQPVFEAGAGRGGVADHSIVSPTFPPEPGGDEQVKGEPEA